MLKDCIQIVKFRCGRGVKAVKIPGPINLPSWSVFDQRKALSFTVFLFSFLLFYNSQQFKYFQVDLLRLCSQFGCSSMSFLSQKLVHATQINITHLIHRLLLIMNRSKKLNHAFVDTGIFGQHDPG